jgi:hypothetical protein
MGVAMPPRSLLVPVILVLLQAQGMAQGTPQECDTTDTRYVDHLARQFAPFIWFSPKEQYFPTLPFFPAFDTWKPRAPGQGSLRDPDRIARTRFRHTSQVIHPLTVRDPERVARDSVERASWEPLDTAYADRRMGPATPPRYSAVFYRVRCLDGRASGTLWTFLRNDAQAWRRSGVMRLYDRGLKSAHFTSIEYYFYFVRDVGLQGHPGDIEKLAVLIPVNPSRKDRGNAPILRNPLLNSLRVIIGAGHGYVTPNNVLVEVGPNRSDPDSNLYVHPHILVELGGHSIAPDNAPPDGAFSPGWDINWNLNESVWGTRDVQGVSGSGYLGEYKGWMTLPRYTGNSVRLFPQFPRPLVAEDTATWQQDVQIMRRERNRTMDVQERLSEQAAAGQEEEADADTTGYVLLPVKPFEKLFRLLAKDTVARDSDGHQAAVFRQIHDSIRTVVDAELYPRLKRGWRFPGFHGMSQDSIDIAIHRMRFWTWPLLADGKEVPLSRTHIWQDFEYRNSPRVFLKRSLYRPTFNALRKFPVDYAALLTTSADFHLGRTGGKQFQIGVVIPALTGILNIPGVLEVQTGLYGRKAHQLGRNRLSLSLVYDRHYRRLLSWYVKPVSWVRKRRAYESDPTASDVVLGFGASVMPLLPMADKLNDPWRSIATTLRMRTGFRIDMMGFRPRPQRVELQISLYSR